MSQNNWEKVQELFEQAINLNKDDQIPFLKIKCGNDDKLFTEVVSLLEADENIHPVLNRKASDIINIEEKLNFVGQQIGSYTIIEEIATGGMGTVFLAERSDGFFDQKVALKIVKAGLSTIPIIRRFQHERQILANLQHPNIARLFDGGVTDDRRPFFTMEYVEGVPIDEYCDKNKLAINERLNLFINVCHAVQYAHNNLVIHRDLKPSNILIKNDGSIKLLDFGISKVLSAEGENEDLPTITQTEIHLMTPEYSSPEQIKNSNVSVSTDVYSLGLVLYKLISGKPAHEFKTRTFNEYEKVVCEQSISKPSTVIVKQNETGKDLSISEICENRNTQIKKLKKILIGDLDNICMMALRKEPERRYPSVEMLAYDIERYLSNLPIQARKESIVYSANKFIARHKKSVITAISLFFIVNGLILYYTIQLKNERDKANLEARKSEQVASFLQDLFLVADPDASKGATITARELLNIGANRLKNKLNVDLEIKAQLLNTIGKVYTNLGLFKSAEEIFNEIRNSANVYNIEKSTYIEALISLGSLLRLEGKYEKAKEVLFEALLKCERELEENDPLIGDCYLNIAGYYYETGDFSKSQIYYDKAEQIFVNVHNPDKEKIAQTAHDLGALEFDKGNLNKADSLYRKALDLEIKLKGETNSAVALYQNDLASVLRHTGKYKEAQELYEKVLKTRILLLGEGHPDVALTYNHLSRLYYNQEMFEQAEPLARKSLEIRSRIFDENHPEVMASRSSLAGVLVGLKKYKEAENLYRLAFKSSLMKLGESHPYTPAILGNLASVLMEEGNYKEAEKCLLQSLEMTDKINSVRPASRANIKVNLADLYNRTNRYKEAEDILRKELTGLIGKNSDIDWLIGFVNSELGYSLFKQSKDLESEGLLINGYNLLKQKKSAKSSLTKNAQKKIIEFYKSKGREDKVAEYSSLN